MASKRLGVLKTLLSGGVLLVIFGWLALLTVHVIKNKESEINNVPLRVKRSVNGLKPTTGGGATYIRWGRTSCPNEAHLVYKGFAAGGWFLHEGGGGDYVCLTDHPKYANVEPAENSHGLIYGAEFELGGRNIFSKLNSNPHNLHDSNVQCAVCRSTARISMVMIPGTKECPGTDWNMEYWGYLMTEHYNHKANRDFVCVDNAPERGSEAGSANQNGALMYHVEGRCGSLPCQPYKHAYELTCVVCTK